MTPEEEKFLNEIARELKGQPKFNEVEQLFFPLRFDKNRPTLYKHTDIAENLMRPEDSKLPLDFYSKSINTNVQNIVNIMIGRLEKTYQPRTAKEETIKPAIKGLYEAEMRADGVDVDSLLNKKKGEKGNWEVVYNWLWDHKYPRWLDQNYWSILQERAKTVSNGIQFKTEAEMESLLNLNKAPKLPNRPPSSLKGVKQEILANQPLWMAIDFEYQNYQLLLLNRSQQGQCLLCPSSAYAPNPIIDKPPLLLPQKNSWAELDENKERFTFTELGTEEFLAIVLEKPLNLPWLTPKQEEALPEWNAERIKELFEQLAQQDNWQVFYQSFEVVA